MKKRKTHAFVCQGLILSIVLLLSLRATDGASATAQGDDVYAGLDPNKISPELKRYFEEVDASRQSVEKPLREKVAQLLAQLDRLSAPAGTQPSNTASSSSGTVSDLQHELDKANSALARAKSAAELRAVDSQEMKKAIADADAADQAVSNAGSDSERAEAASTKMKAHAALQAEKDNALKDDPEVVKDQAHEKLIAAQLRLAQAQHDLDVADDRFRSGKFIPTFSNSTLNEVLSGVLTPGSIVNIGSDGSIVQIDQVIDKGDALVLKGDTMFWVSHLDTSELADDQKVRLSGLIALVGNRSYTTVLGSSKTVFELRLFDPAAEIASARAGNDSTSDSDADPGDDSNVEEWSGTGIIISSGGLVLTNRHVAKGAKKLKVVLTDGREIPAVIKTIDDAYDLAVIQLGGEKSYPYLQLSQKDSPPEGAECLVMGFPLTDKLGSDIKATRGIVSSSEAEEGHGADILTDAKVNPGNSGGPILDNNGNVMAIVSMKSISTETEDSYGIGISAGHIRQFLKRNRISAESGNNVNALKSEEIVARAKPATVCILANK